ncbi:MAG: hypothetical protein WCA44_12435 [Acidobacteriaceae bacterium]|jgi:hypothetical protein
MDMFLMCLCIAGLGFGVAAIALRAATPPESSESAAQPEMRRVNVVALNRFSSGRAAAAPAIPAHPVPIELLLLQIENHVRLEQAAAELFLESPTHDLLYSKTPSPFVN